MLRIILLSNPENVKFMNRYLSIFFLLLTLSSFGQSKFTYDCNLKPVSFVGGINSSISNGYLLNGVRLGIWQNNKPSGFTLFVGYTNVLSKTIDKDKVLIPGESAFVEFGWKIRATDWCILHGYVGDNKNGQYLGASSLFQVNKSVLVGVDYKQKVFGLITYFAF